MTRIGLLGCKGTTLDVLHAALHAQDAPFRITRVVTLPESIASKNQVAFYRGGEIESLCKQHDVPLSYTTTYHMNDAADLKLFKGLKLDVLAVIGWERLLPAAILETLGKFACGMHGSAFGLPRGRGRSPLNWSLITNQRRFVTSLFRYNPATDAGDVLGSQIFDINEFDTIATLHAKNRIAMFQLLCTYIPLTDKGAAPFLPQPPTEPTYYPKRTPQDSGIDWRQTTLEIYNLIRAVAPPYPPAFCFLNGTKLFITEAHPFDSALFPPSRKPGEIVDVSIALHQFVVKTRDGSLIVKRFEGVDITAVRVGDVLGGIDAAEHRRKIVERYPADVPPSQWEIPPTL